MKIGCNEVAAKRRLGATQLALAVSTVLWAAASHGVESAAPESNAPSLDEVVVLGRGETRQVQSVTAEQIEQLPPGTSPLKAIEKLPGVNFQSADPYGAYEWSTRITVRGFNQNRLGFTLDEVPLGDMTYGNHNGLHISRAISSELVDRVELSQGAGSLDTASSSNLGGTVKFTSATPAEEFGVAINQMYGSDAARRTFARVDTGSIGPDTRLYLAFADASTDKWKGGGEQESTVYTVKLVQPLSEGSITAYYNHSDRAEIDYQDLSYDIVQRRGWDWDNWYPNWDAAVAAADICDATCDDAYWNASGLRKDDLGYVKFDLPFGEMLNWTTTLYRHKDIGQGLWATPYVASPGGAPLSIRTTEYDLDRAGVITSLTFDFDSHLIKIGGWYEDNAFTQARRFYAEPSRVAPSRSFYEMQTGAFRTDWEYHFTTITSIVYAQDTWSITDSVRLDFGFRSVKSENTAVTNVAVTIPSQVKSGTIDADEPFLPQIGINWAITDELEIFASGAQNVRTFASSGTSGPFSTSAAGFEAIRDVVEPETSTNLEAGLRFRGETLEGLIAVYHVDFQDRLLGITQGPGIQGNPSVLANVGSVTTNGIEGALTWRLMSNLNWFTSVSWNDSQYADDYTTTNSSGVPTVVPVSGKQVTDTPEILIKSELAYDNGSFFVRADVNYTDERYYTYLNDGGVDAYTLFNAALGYRFESVGPMKEVSIQADVTNITDEQYFSTIDSNGFTASDLTGTTQTLLRGAPRQFFVSAKIQF
jgi:iron complex outermembrane receptor protein